MQVVPIMLLLGVLAVDELRHAYRPQTDGIWQHPTGPVVIGLTAVVALILLHRALSLLR